MESAPTGMGGDAAAEGRVTDGMAEGDPADDTVGGTTDVEGIVVGTPTGGTASDAEGAIAGLAAGAIVGAGAKTGAVSSGMVADPWAEAGVSGETRIRLGKIRYRSDICMYYLKFS
ncbi:hypothetical protein [Nitrosospira sp. NRS527]|uniref:hypothetical protein n=1 Tax=Nitrosospira sp. NRS527 TaxID=155925 RepID=UPI001FD3D5D4|nr:hypothetical protein [Nitrosospira sp. NRS527]